MTEVGPVVDDFDIKLIPWYFKDFLSLCYDLCGFDLQTMYCCTVILFISDENLSDTEQKFRNKWQRGDYTKGLHGRK